VTPTTPTTTRTPEGFSALGGVVSVDGAVQVPSRWEQLMADKSPRQHMAKKPTKSIKEKRAEKHAKADAKNHIDLGKK
jgi:hypothetical protein